MEYRIVDAFNFRDKTIISLDRRRSVKVLGCKKSVVDGITYAVYSIHPDEFVIISYTDKPSELIGKNIKFIN